MQQNAASIGSLFTICITIFSICTALATPASTMEELSRLSMQYADDYHYS